MWRSRFGVHEQGGVGARAACLVSSSPLMAACAWHSPAQICMFSRPMIRLTGEPGTVRAEQHLTVPGIDATTSTAFDEVQQESVSAFTAAVVLT